MQTLLDNYDVLQHMLDKSDFSGLDQHLDCITSEDMKRLAEVKDQALNLVLESWGWYWCDTHGYTNQKTRFCRECNMRQCNGCVAGCMNESLCNGCYYDDY